LHSSAENLPRLSQCAAGHLVPDEGWHRELFGVSNVEVTAVIVTVPDAAPWRPRIRDRDDLRAITVIPGKSGAARLEEVPEPAAAEGSVLVHALALGVCATDREIISGQYGTAPPGESRLILGHESLGRVEMAPPESGLRPGDVVVGIVRRPDPVPCPACAAGEWDMCRNGRYSERGIKERHGYGSERFRVEPDFVLKIDPALGRLGVLLEPASIVAKAWDHIDRIGHRAREWRPRTLLVTGAGPIGLLAAMMGTQRGLDVHVFDHHQSGVKPKLVHDLGATYHGTGIADALEHIAPDVIIECTGAPSVVRHVLGHTAAIGIICLTGVSSDGHTHDLDFGWLGRTLVLNNDVVFGTVNANRRHYELAADALALADRKWLGRLITRCVPLACWSEALEPRPDDVKVIIEFPST
jgi:threonine dehydrogenase-like Zn-dependent dehydrogenase